ncbi:MAG: hypothetical protein AAGG51_12095 [Cyanobacteria bacterium P01_G01_bin.54]
MPTPVSAVHRQLLTTQHTLATTGDISTGISSCKVCTTATPTYGQTKP